jgi:hypothetical protein
MPVDEPSQRFRIEPRWPVALAVIAVFFFLVSSADRIRPFPSWVSLAFVIGLLLPMAGIWLSGGDLRWRRLERALTLIFFFFAEAEIHGTVWYLVAEMLHQTGELSGRQLLGTAVGAWFIHILAFSMAYWQLDRAGPEARANEMGTRPDWLFPEMGVPDEAPPQWRPTYVDYLFLSFSTAVAFSAADTVPLTTRAKVLMMIESAASLVMLLVIVSYGIGALS